MPSVSKRSTVTRKCDVLTPQQHKQRSTGKSECWMNGMPLTQQCRSDLHCYLSMLYDNGVERIIREARAIVVGTVGLSK